jgi:hypothetical protein
LAETNQKKSNGRGGARPGAGRKPGSATRKTREIADRAAAEGLTPLEYMLEVMRNANLDPRERLSAAVSAAPYVHPKLASIEHTGADGGAIQAVHRIELIPLGNGEG